MSVKHITPHRSRVSSKFLLCLSAPLAAGGREVGKEQMPKTTINGRQVIAGRLLQQ
jgi:hypothetical protein